MNTSFQKRVPRARINITLDIETGGAKKKRELPLKLLVLANLCGNLKQNIYDKNKRKIEINHQNIDQIMAKISPHLSFTVPNLINKIDENINIKLNFKKLQDFNPEYIATAIPETKTLIAMRNLLKDLRANLIDNHEFKRALEKILRNSKDKTELQNYLANRSPLIKDQRD
ncbi:MAG: type VI secretion system contractile sheath small subunit [Gammaproteobacteria bacterium]|nr:type VI secretion system contractile sheath small subunit [Gammaproteobacteria bacterium]